MLRPAILYADEIAEQMQNYYYTDDMIYETGSLENWCPEIKRCPDDTLFQYAIVNSHDELIGFLSYKVDWYVNCAYNFGLFSFDRGNALIGKEVYDKMRELVSRFHRVEWRAVSGNPACKGYDRFVKKYGGNKHIFRDCIKDREGKYHDDIIYEIIGYNPPMMKVKEAGTFGKRLKELLKMNNMSQRQLAKATGMTEAAVSRYMKDERVPKATTVSKMAEVLNISVEYLIGD